MGRETLKFKQDLIKESSSSFEAIHEYNLTVNRPRTKKTDWYWLEAINDLSLL